MDLGHIICCNVKPDTALMLSTVATEGSMEEQLQDWDQEDEDDGEMQVLCRAQQHSGSVLSILFPY